MKTKTKKVEDKKKKPAYQQGKFIYKPTKSVILLCSCGNKYLKTREGQKTCLKCLQQVLR